MVIDIFPYWETNIAPWWTPLATPPTLEDPHRLPRRWPCVQSCPLPNSCFAIFPPLAASSLLSFSLICVSVPVMACLVKWAGTRLSGEMTLGWHGSKAACCNTAAVFDLFLLSKPRGQSHRTPSNLLRRCRSHLLLPVPMLHFLSLQKNNKKTQCVA